MDRHLYVFDVKKTHSNHAWPPPAPKKKGAGRNPKEVTEKMKLLDPDSYIRKMEKNLKKKLEEMATGLQKMQEEGQRPEEIRKYVKKKGNEEQKIVKEIERLKGLRGGAEAGPAGPVVDPAPAPVPDPMAGKWAYQKAGPVWPMVGPAPVPDPMSMPGQISDQWAYLGAGPVMTGPDFAGTDPVPVQMAQMIEPFRAQPNQHAIQYYDAGANLGWQQPQFAAAPPEAATWPIPGDIGNPILVADEPWIEPQPPAEDDLFL